MDAEEKTRKARGKMPSSLSTRCRVERTSMPARVTVDVPIRPLACVSRAVTPSVSSVSSVVQLLKLSGNLSQEKRRAKRADSGYGNTSAICPCATVSFTSFQ